MGLRFFVDLFSTPVNEESMSVDGAASSVKSNESFCPLCGGSERKSVNNQHRVGVSYWHCASCDLIAMDPQFFLSAEAERERYLSHQNSIQDQGYLKHLQPMVQMISVEFKSDVRPQLLGLDFGSGPQPILQSLLQTEHFRIEAYDPFFSPRAQALPQTYDFIVSTEVVEHFFLPQIEMQQMISLLKPGGSLFLMTQLHAETESGSYFNSWWYPKDATHVSFYSQKTMEWIAHNFNLIFSSDQKSLIQLKKRD